MADKKISQLALASTPLSGGETLPVVQTGSTVQVSVTNLTAGRNVDAVSIINGLGAVGTPSYTFTGDTNTGMWSPTADTVAVSTAGVERARVTNVGNVGIGTTAPQRILHLATGEPTIVLQSTSAPVDQNRWRTRVSTSGNFSIGSINDAFSAGQDAYQIVRGTGTAVDSHRFLTANVERMRIDSSGNFLVATTSSSSSSTTNGFVVAGSNGSIVSRRESGAAQTHAIFVNGGTTVGSIVTSTTATTYNTSSDYRLKDIDGPITGSGAYIDALKPVQGSWKADGSRFIGLLAHEVQEVSETQIATGEKDGEEMQAMDYSAPEIIANLIAEIQSLRARVAQLEKE